MKTKLMNMALLGAVLLSAVACSDPGSIGAPQERSEVTLTLSVDVPTKAIGDPGTSHLEDSAAWADIVVYFVYDNGAVYPRRVTRTEYEASDSKRFRYTLPQGTGKVYAVAFPDGDDVDRYLGIASRADVEALRTSTLNGTVDEKKLYMLGCFSGISSENFNFSEDNVLQNDITVTLTRLIAKVDVHYDLQSAYEDGGYTQADMSHITFRGLAQGYFFPELNAEALERAQLTDVAVIDAAMSQRNGRTAFYAFPGVNNSVRFSVKYGVAGAQPVAYDYTATFDNVLERASWHYVRFSMNGSKDSATGSGITVSRTEVQP